MKIPTFAEVMGKYLEISIVERIKNGRPGKRTVTNVLSGVRQLLAAIPVSVDSPIDAITRPHLDTATVALVNRGMERLTVKEYLLQYQSLFAKWTLDYYHDAGWQIPPIAIPLVRTMTPCYVRPDAEMLRRVRTWYENLNDKLWFPATMMLEFAMRNGDVMRLRRENFVERCNRRYLSYTPHKTALSSGRRVLWPVHASLWERINRIGFNGQVSSVRCSCFTAINRQLRELGFTGSKASYELRKICIDHVYQRFGAEMATSISGDDIKTITRYYADPAQPNIGDLRIIDLLKTL
ncbi:MAG: hypothetical protein IJI54_05355 [Kiritimatiellae bacterium]|nr:hypothetical protein [Kiritimatiellia bacterium]